MTHITLMTLIMEKKKLMLQERGQKPSFFMTMSYSGLKLPEHYLKSHVLALKLKSRVLALKSQLFRRKVTFGVQNIPKGEGGH